MIHGSLPSQGRNTDIPQQGILTEKGWLSTVELLIKTGYLGEKENILSVRKAADLN